MPTRLKSALKCLWAIPITRVLPIPPPIPKTKAGVRKVPMRIVPRNTRNMVSINPTLKPNRAMAVRAMILANPNRSQGDGEGMNISRLWMTTAIATREEIKAFRLILLMESLPENQVPLEPEGNITCSLRQRTTHPPPLFE